MPAEQHRRILDGAVTALTSASEAYASLAGADEQRSSPRALVAADRRCIDEWAKAYLGPASLPAITGIPTVPAKRCGSSTTSVGEINTATAIAVLWDETPSAALSGSSRARSRGSARRWPRAFGSEPARHLLRQEAGCRAIEVCL